MSRFVRIILLVRYSYLYTCRDKIYKISISRFVVSRTILMMYEIIVPIQFIYMSI